MKIGIDGNEANVDKKVGIGEYAYELLVEFSKPLSSEIEFEIFLKTEPRVELPKTSGNWKYNVFGPKKLWTQIALPLNLFMDFPKPDVFFSPTHYAPRFSPVPTVISVWIFRMFTIQSFLKNLICTNCVIGPAIRLRLQSVS